ncbi:MAG: protein kinase domain-containing protein, partial [Gemmataceae bacterium]
MIPTNPALSSQRMAAPVLEFRGAFGPAAESREIGTFGPYRILRLLGRGGMGAVFLGLDIALQRKVAIKLLLPKHSDNPIARERFLREARATAAIRSDHVVTIYQVGDVNDTPFLVMEYLRGQTLEDYLRNHPAPSFAQLLNLTEEILLGLQAAHRLGVVHRDVKPVNIWLEAPNGRVKLIDFGLARQTELEPDARRRVQILGTPEYMAPEQARGQPVDARADLYSLGVILYRLTTGELPIQGANNSEIIAALLQHKPMPVSKQNPSVPMALAEWIDRLIQKNPADRPASAEKALIQLEQIRTEFHKNVTVTGLVVNVPMSISAGVENTWTGIGVTTPMPSVVVSTETRRPWKSDRGLVWTVLGSCVLAILLVSVMLLFYGNRKASEITKVDPNSRTRPLTSPQNSLIQLVETKRPPYRCQYRYLDADWEDATRESALVSQVVAVREELSRRNKQLSDSDIQFVTENHAVVEVRLNGDKVEDVTPLRALPELQRLFIESKTGGGRFTELAPLTDLPLTALHLSGTSVSELSPLRGMPLESLDISHTRVYSLAALKGMMLKRLWINKTEITELRPLVDMPLTVLSFEQTKVNDLELLAKFPIRELRMGPGQSPPKNLGQLPLVELMVHDWNEPLASGLENNSSIATINNEPAETFWNW